MICVLCGGLRFQKAMQWSNPFTLQAPPATTQGPPTAISPVTLPDGSHISTIFLLVSVGVSTLLALRMLLVMVSIATPVLV